MGTWEVGPFDNDTAADWCAHLDRTAPAQRVQFIRQALTAVVEESDDYLDSDLAVEAIAAAAIVASQLPGGATIDSPYAPEFLLEGGTVEVPDDIPPLALRALDRVVGDNSEWRELWEDADLYPAALATLEPIRTALEQAAGSQRPSSTRTP